jgi:hypothetical protein
MRTLLCAAAYAAAVCAGTQEVVEEGALSADGGFDIRFRYDWYDDLPNGNGSRNGQVSTPYADLSRTRTRLWGSLYHGGKDDFNFGIYARIANEFRTYHNYAPSHNYTRFPEQLFADSLYLDINNILDRVSIRAGRQEMRYGAGRVIADGTPGDGARAAYFDAARISVKASGKTTGDFFATYTKPVDTFLTLGDADGSDYNLTSFGGALGDATKIEDMTEWALGTYWTLKEIDAVPMEFYLIYKDESRWYKGGKDANNVIPGRQYGTAGIRATPQVTDDLNGEIEAAYQFGRTDPGSGIDSQPINA